MKLKICASCEREFPATLEYFHKNKSIKGGLQSYCKQCVKEYGKEYRKSNPEQFRERTYKHLYGILIEDWDKMYEDQLGRCKVCDKHQSEFTLRLSIDHNHDTGKVRGLLCHKCNTRLGHIEEYIKNKKKWDKYLKGDLL